MAAKKATYIIVDSNYDNVREVQASTLKTVEEELQNVADERGYASDELVSAVKVYEVTAQLTVDAEQSVKVYVRP